MPSKKSPKSTTDSKAKHSAVPPTLAPATAAKKPAVVEVTLKEAAAPAAKPEAAVKPEVAAKPVIAAEQPAATAKAASPAAAPIEIKSVEAKSPAAVVEPTPAVAQVTQAAAAVEAAPAVEIAALSDADTALAYDLSGLDADLARDAALSLGRSGNVAAIEPLIAALCDVHGYTHAVVRAAAAVALGCIGDARAVDALVDAVIDPSAEVSAEAIRSLAQLGDARGVAPLSDVVRNRVGYFQPVARRAAVLGLARLGGAEAQGVLRAVADDSWEDQILRDDAWHALGELSGRAA